MTFVLKPLRKKPSKQHRKRDGDENESATNLRQRKGEKEARTTAKYTKNVIKTQLKNHKINKKSTKKYKTAGFGDLGG